jgi:hypothetical protein
LKAPLVAAVSDRRPIILDLLDLAEVDLLALSELIDGIGAAAPQLKVVAPRYKPAFGDDIARLTNPHRIELYLSVTEALAEDHAVEPVRS